MAYSSLNHAKIYLILRMGPEVFLWNQIMDKEMFLGFFEALMASVIHKEGFTFRQWVTQEP